MLLCVCVAVSGAVWVPLYCTGSSRFEHTASRLPFRDNKDYEEEVVTRLGVVNVGGRFCDCILDWKDAYPTLRA